MARAEADDPIGGLPAGGVGEETLQMTRARRQLDQPLKLATGRRRALGPLSAKVSFHKGLAADWLRSPRTASRPKRANDTIVSRLAFALIARNSLA
ncbi:MAG: hypothetical protein CFK52_07925 [Chloracidobacterium sp. CP2_5A]|nr:MAG: hypothetical protein CFK52_07925 [Chloracidobacterium sp. CP2_5A]